MKKILTICLFSIGIVLIVLGITPEIIKNIEIDKLEKEVVFINDCLKNRNIQKIKIEELDKNISISDKKLEKELEFDLKSIINIATNISDINKDNTLNNTLSIDNIKDKEISAISDYLESTKVKLNSLDEDIKKI